MVDQAEIHRKVVSGDVEERREAVKQLRSDFADLPDKEQAWDDLIHLTQDEDTFVPQHAAYALGAVFFHIRIKEPAWNDLIRLAQDENHDVRMGAVHSLGVAFPHIPDKEQTWKDLIWLTLDKYNDVRRDVTRTLGVAFLHLTDKELGWKCLHWLTQDKDDYVRQGGADALGAAFPHITNKKKAWKDLHRLTRDEDRGVRMGAVYAIGTAFPHIANKKQAWEDLYRLALGRDVDMWWRVAGVLDTIFSRITNKKQIFKDPHQMACCECRDVRMAANHSLGQASIFKATETESEDDFESELKNALEFFERSSKGATFFTNPSSFCLPFYRSFYTITFEKAGAKGEAEKYLAEAKSASEGSEIKEILLEAVETLANALSEAHKVTDFNAMKSDLNAYRQYCDRAADLIGAAEEGTPGAARVLRRGLPIIDERIKEIVREIQEKARAVCIETRDTGTPYEPLGIEVNKWAGELSDRDYLQNARIASRIADILGEFCNLLPEDKREYPYKIVEELREESKPENKLIDIATALSYLVPSIKSQLQNAAKSPTDETRSDEQPSQKTGHSTTVFAGAGSNITVTQTETGSGDVTVTNDANATKELQPEERRIDHRKKTAIEILAAIAVSVLVGIVSTRYLENLTPTTSTLLAFIALIILLIIILTRNRDKSS